MPRPGSLPRIVMPSGCAMRGASGTFTPNLSGASVNPYQNVIQGKTDLVSQQDVQLVSGVLCPTAINGGPPYDDNCCFFPGTYGDDVVVIGRINRLSDSGTATFQEIGFLLCADPKPKNVSAYEMQISVTPTAFYSDIARWNGGDNTDVNNFTFLQHWTTGLTASQDGWMWKAKKVGNLLSVELDTTGTGNSFSQLGSAQDITSLGAVSGGSGVYRRGIVGVQLWQRGGAVGDLTKFGISNIVITAP